LRFRIVGTAALRYGVRGFVLEIIRSFVVAIRVFFRTVEVMQPWKFSPSDNNSPG
jgi:hypothetical protein